MKDTQSNTASQNDDATPETDQYIWIDRDGQETVRARLARKLERERNLAKGQAIYWQDKATQFEKERDESIKLAGELIHIIRINALRGAMGPEIAKKKVDDFLCPYGTRLLNIKGGANAI